MGTDFAAYAPVLGEPPQQKPLTLLVLLFHVLQKKDPKLPCGLRVAHEMAPPSVALASRSSQCSMLVCDLVPYAVAFGDNSHAYPWCEGR